MSRQERAARIYAGRGWVPLPLNWVDSGGRCSCQRGGDCGNPGKHPRVRWADRDTVTVDELGRWWQWWPRAGVGIVTGARSGIVVVDVDPRHDGDRSVAALEEVHGPLDTLTVETGGGGVHLYFAHPGFPVGNVQTAGKLGAGIDVRGDGGQVAAPPTIHASGRPYRWRDWHQPVASMPQWLADRLRPPPPAPRRPIVIDRRVRARNYGEAAIDGEVDRVLEASHGDRNATLYRAACRLGSLVAGGLIADWRAAQALRDAGLAIGLTASECEATILSGLDRGQTNPRRVIAS